MKTKMIFIRSIAGLAMLVASFADAENIFPAQDYGKLDSSAVPEGWKINGKYELKNLEADSKQQGFSITATETGTVVVYSPIFPVAALKNYVLTCEFRSSNFGEKGYNQIVSSLVLIFQDSENKQLSNFPYNEKMESPGPEQMGFPYTTVKNWTKIAMSFIAPEGAVNAGFMLSLSNSKANDARPEVQICNIAVREFPDSPAGAIIFNMPAAQLNPGPAYDKAVFNQDKSTRVVTPGFRYPGTDSLLTTKKDIKGNIGYGPYKKMPAGIYELAVRLKISDNSLETPVFTVAADTNPNAGVLSICGKDFKKADEFQEFRFRFLKPTDDWLNLPCYKAADCVITIDDLTVAPVRQFDSAAIKKYFPEK